MRRSNYDRHPQIDVARHRRPGLEAAGRPVGAELRRALAAAPNGRAPRSRGARRRVQHRAAPGGRASTCGACCRPTLWIDAAEALRPAPEIERVAAPWLGGDDPLFGFLANPSIDALSRPGPHRSRSRAHRGGARARSSCSARARCAARSPTSSCTPTCRAGKGSCASVGGGCRISASQNAGEKASLQYKRSYFVDWRMVDGLKRESLGRWDYLLDSTIEGDPRLVTGRAVRHGLEHAAHRPFRLVPFFDPAPWGGQWMKEVCGLDPAVAELRLVLRLRARGEQPAVRFRRRARRDVVAATWCSPTRARCWAPTSSAASAPSSRSASTSSTRWAEGT